MRELPRDRPRTPKQWKPAKTIASRLNSRRDPASITIVESHLADQEPKQNDDQELVARILGGDNKAFRTLVERYQRKVYMIVRLRSRQKPGYRHGRDAGRLRQGAPESGALQR
jgi:hypothetical protein